MIKVLTQKTAIKGSNLVCFIEKQTDIKALDFLKLETKYIDKIKKIIKGEESQVCEFFIGTKEFERVYVLFFYSKGSKTLLEFLGEQIVKFENNLTLLCENNHNLFPLLDSAVLSRYKFQLYKTQKKGENIYVLTDTKNKKGLEDRIKTLQNITFARDLGETPSCDLTPEGFVNTIKKIKFKNIKVKILTPKDIEKKGLNLLNAVGKGSIHKPYMVILEKIKTKNKETYGIVGKGVTFDTGGIQVKPDTYMYEMKGDMCGAANTLAIMKELDEKDLNVNVVACLCLAENNISGGSCKPSDIYTAYNKKTVDIIHTDAEGRLILADGMSYISKNYNLQHIMTIATLTGAAIVALGYRYAGIMGSDKNLINKFLSYSKNNFEKYVELPYDNYLIEKTKSDIADIKNLTEGIKAGSSMGAAFLSNFVDNNEAYTHIDIAGPAINSFEPYGLMNKGMTGFGVDSISTIFTEL